jgi:transposase
VTAHPRFLLHLHLTHIAALDTAVADVEGRIREALAPFRAAISLLMTMPAVSETAAAVILGEIGDDMSKFPSAGHLLSWAGLCPRLDESAGKRRSTRTRPGAPWLKTNPRPNRVACRSQEAQLLPSPVSAIEKPSRSQEGDRRLRRFYAD